MNYNAYTNHTIPQQPNIPWQQWPSAPNVNLPQPPFMPPHVVGNLKNCWDSSMSAAPSASPMPCESFPYNPQNYRYKWRQYENNDDYTSYSKKPRLDEKFIDFCDVCDRGFKTEEKKQQHYSEHTTCSEPGCSFVAHYKIVEIHKRNLHGPNGFRIKLDTPEDIKKWREERRRNFPSSKRIEEKKKEEAVKRASGAVLQEQSFGKFKKSRGGFKNNSRTKVENEKHIDNTSQGHIQTSHQLNNDYTSTPNDNTSLSQIVSNYNSEDDAEDKTEDKSSNINKKSEYKKQRFDKRNNKENKCKYTPLRRPSLLRMLLEPEIRRERNDILQCVRYIVENKFFDTSSS